MSRCGIWRVMALKKRRKKSSSPPTHPPHDANSAQLIYNQSKYSIYQLWTPGGYKAILPREFLHQLKDLPDDVLNVSESFVDQFIGPGMDWFNIRFGVSMTVLRHDLNNHLEELLPIMKEVITDVAGQALPAGEAWTSVRVQDVATKIMNSAYCRVILGPAIYQNPQWLEILDKGYDVYEAAFYLMDFPMLVRPLIAALHPVFWRLKRKRKTAIDLLVPELRKDSQHGKTDTGSTDFIQWIKDASLSQTPPVPYEKQAELLLLVAMDGLTGLRVTLQQVLLDLAAHPEVIPTLRQEIQTVRQTMAPGAPFTREQLTHLIKEHSTKAPSYTNPLANTCTHVPNPVALERKVMKSLALSNGIILPPGLKIAIPSSQIALDPEIWDSPREFRPWRFSDIRTKEREQKHNYQYTSSNFDLMAF
ncbi:MAG: hypothetical protein Q9218_007791, partial [Villophora microphyllina]